MLELHSEKVILGGEGDILVLENDILGGEHTVLGGESFDLALQGGKVLISYYYLAFCKQIVESAAKDGDDPAKRVNVRVIGITGKDTDDRSFGQICLFGDLL